MEKSFQELTENEEDVIEKNIIFIFGNNTKEINNFIGFLKNKTDFINEPGIGKFLSPHRDGNVRYFKKQQGLDFPRYDYFFFSAYRNIWSKFLKKLIINRFFTETSKEGKYTILKELEGSNSSDIITEIFSNSKLLIIIEEPKNFISVQNFEFEKNQINNLKQNRLERIKEKTESYVSKLKILLNAYLSHNEKLRLLVKYEDLLNNTAKELKKIYDFIAIEIDDDELEKISIQLKQNVEKLKKLRLDLTEDELGIIKKISDSCMKDVNSIRSR